jgi:hypothetical protein
MIGDYAEDSDNPNFKEDTDGPWKNRESWKDISLNVLIDLIKIDRWFAEDFHERVKNNGSYSYNRNELARVKYALASQGFEQKTQPRDKCGRFARKPVEV